MMRFKKLHGFVSNLGFTNYFLLSDIGISFDQENKV